MCNCVCSLKRKAAAADRWRAIDQSPDLRRGKTFFPLSSADTFEALLIEPRLYFMTDLDLHIGLSSAVLPAPCCAQQTGVHGMVGSNRLVVYLPEERADTYRYKSLTG